MGAVSSAIPLLGAGALGLVFTLPASVRWNRGLQRNELNGNHKWIVVVTAPFPSVFSISQKPCGAVHIFR